MFQKQMKPRLSPLTSWVFLLFVSIAVITALATFVCITKSYKTAQEELWHKWEKPDQLGLSQPWRLMSSLVIDTLVTKRLGTKQPNKIRPILATLQSEDEATLIKKRVLRNLGNLQIQMCLTRCILTHIWQKLTEQQHMSLDVKGGQEELGRVFHVWIPMPRPFILLITQHNDTSALPLLMSRIICLYFY